jgi:hypothetical protein
VKSFGAFLMVHDGHHSKEQADNDEALAVKEHVKAMLRKLATRMKERPTFPKSE